MSKAHPEDFVVKEPLVLIHIGRDIGDDLSIKYPADVYATVRGFWRMYPGDLPSGYLVLAKTRERVLGAFRAKYWFQDPNPKTKFRWGFVGDPAEMSSQLDYVGKRVPNRYRNRSVHQWLSPD